MVDGALLIHPTNLNHRAHSTIENQDTLRKQAFQ